jgi:chemotaxis protein methyltransferase CheR
MTRSEALEDVEIELLLEGIYRHYGYDFRNYAVASLKRRVKQRVREEKLNTISGLKELVLHNREAMEGLVHTLSISVSSMFRDPGLYKSFRQNVVPLLRTYPFIRVWHAGCATGEEVYSMAILLHEEGLYERSRLYATDMNESVLRRAREGIYALKDMRQYTADYQRGGGTGEFSEYYTAEYDSAIFRPWLRKNVVFAQHNLATDGVFNEFHVILCRNVLIYFNPELQARVHRLFLGSLERFGFLCLGSKETLKFSPYEHAYAEIDAVEKIYRRLPIPMPDLETAPIATSQIDGTTAGGRSPSPATGARR